MSVTAPVASRTRRFLGGLGFGYLNQLLLIAVGFVMTPFLLGRLGAHDYGLWLLVGQLLGYLGLADLGVVALLPRETAYAVGRAPTPDAASDLKPLVGKTTVLVLLQTPLVAAIAAAAWLLLPADWNGLKGPLVPVLVVFALTFPARILGGVLLGLQDLTFLGALNSAAILISTGVTVALVLEGRKLDALTIAWIVSCVAPLPFQWLRLRLRFPFALPDRLPPLRWDEARTQLGHGAWLSVGNIAQILLRGTDLLLIGQVCGAASIVPFACTAKLVNVLANQPAALLHTAGPGLSELKVAAPERMLTVCAALSQVMLILSGAVFCVVLAVNEGFVRLWIGPDQFGGALLNLSLLALMVLRHWNTTAIFALVCFGRERRMSLTMLLEGLVTIGSSLVLLALLGPIGAALGGLIGLVAISVPGNLLAIAEETGAPVHAFVATLWPWSWRFTGVAVVAGLVARKWAPATLLELSLAASAVGIVYGAVMVPLLVREPVGPYIRPFLPWLRQP